MVAKEFGGKSYVNSSSIPQISQIKILSQFDVTDARLRVRRINQSNLMKDLRIFPLLIARKGSFK